MPGKDIDGVLRDLEDSIFNVENPEETVNLPEEEARRAVALHEEKRRRTFPTLVSREDAGKILKDILKEKNQRSAKVMGLELIFKPYWFFTYTAELMMRDERKNIVDSEELGGRIAMDAVNGAVADHLQDLMDHEPIDLVDLSDELAEVGGEAKLLEPQITGTKLEHFVQQKISGVLRADKENVSVAGFELIWAPVYKFWITIKKRNHNVQIDGCGGYPLNYDDLPLRVKTWFDVIREDVELLREPKKWRDLLSKKGDAMRVVISGKPKAPKKMSIELIVVLLLALMFLAGLANKDTNLMLIGGVGALALFWLTNARRKKPLVPLPPPPIYEIPPGPQGY